MAKFLKNRAKVLVRFLEFETYRRCLHCAEETLHKKAEDEQGNNHYFCKKCGAHN